MDVPYIAYFQSVVAANGLNTVLVTVPSGSEFRIDRIQYTSTGAFGFADVRTSDGQHYVNATPSYPLLNTLFPGPFSGGAYVLDFPGEISIPNGALLYIDLKDTSGSSNTINLALVGKSVLGE